MKTNVWTTAILCWFALSSARHLLGSDSWVAIDGEPFGVASITLPIGTVEAERIPRILINSPDARIFYPAIVLETLPRDPQEGPSPGVLSKLLENRNSDFLTTPIVDSPVLAALRTWRPSANLPSEFYGEVPPNGLDQRNADPRGRPRRLFGDGRLVDGIRKVIRSARETVDPPRLITIHFLFRGTEPIALQLTGDYTDSITIMPMVAESMNSPDAATKTRNAYAEVHRELLLHWWIAYQRQAKAQRDTGDYPPGIESYLCAMLAERLNLPPAIVLDKADASKKPDVPMTTLQLLGGTEELREEIHKNIFRQPLSIADRQVPLPAPPVWNDQPIPVVTADISVETIATRIPQECFYLRFGSFPNFLWFQQLLQAQGRGIHQMIIARGIDFQTDARVQRMLGTKTSLLAKLFGEKIIEDMAIVGLDLYVQDGPALAVVFQSKEPDLLVESLQQDRRVAAKRESNNRVVLRDIDIEGVNVSFLSSPDNHIRSFLLRRDNFVYVTTSETLCRRLIQVAAGKTPSLAEDPSFRYARFSLPNQNQYAIFAFFSPKFFRSLVSPAYLIELRRRFTAIAQLQVADLAMLAATNEAASSRSTSANPASTSTGSDNPLQLSELISAKFLPRWFLDSISNSQPIRLVTPSASAIKQDRSVRAEVNKDGSKKGELGTGNIEDNVEYIDATKATDSSLNSNASRWVDSLRGARGSFLPIPDVQINGCTQEEAESYREMAAYYATHWQETDPLVIAVRKFQHPTNPDMERLAVEAYVAPFGGEKYGWVSHILAPPVQSKIALPSDDMVSVQAHLAGETLFSLRPVADHVLFAGVKDMTPPLPDTKLGLIGTLRTFQTTPAYVGAWPLPGYLDRLPFGLGGGPADALGFSRLLIGAWRWQGNGFSLLSFDRSIVENCLSQLQIVPARDPAQVRAMIGDLENSRLSVWVNTSWYRRGLAASRGNAMLFDLLQSQFAVPPAQSMGFAEDLLDGKLQCPLGGSYELLGDSFWGSSAWPASTPLSKSNAQLRNASVSVNTAGLSMNPRTAIPPPEYRAPWIGWFRGGEVHLTQLASHLVLIGQVDLQKMESFPNVGPVEEIELPKMDFDLFSIPFNLFGAKDQPAANSAAEKNNSRKKKQEDTPESAREF